MPELCNICLKTNQLILLRAYSGNSVVNMKTKISKHTRGKFMSLFQPLVAGKVLENCGRVFVGCKAPTKIAGIFQNFSAEVNTFWKKKTEKNHDFQQSFHNNLVNYKKIPTFA